jgi:hypothetical protein
MVFKTDTPIKPPNGFIHWASRNHNLLNFARATIQTWPTKNPTKTQSKELFVELKKEITYKMRGEYVDLEEPWELLVDAPFLGDCSDLSLLTWAYLLERDFRSRIVICKKKDTLFSVVVAGELETGVVMDYSLSHPAPVDFYFNNVATPLCVSNLDLMGMWYKVIMN